MCRRGPLRAPVARALAQEPRILVLDEPTASLDFGNQLRVLDAVRRLAGNRALSVLLSTHHPEQAFSCADMVAVLAGGELLQLGSPTETITAETLRACYSVDVAVLPVAATASACRAPISPDDGGQAYSAASRLGSSASSSARSFGGDIGRSRSRAPIAAWIALATAAIGGTIGTSPTPRTPNGWRGFGKDRIDHRHVGGDRTAVVEKPGFSRRPSLS